MADHKVRVRFTTGYEKYRITDAPFAVPSKLGRYGLSEVVNHLLDKVDSPQPFDFAINGQLVRVSLKKFVTVNRISTEDVVTIEYMPAISISDESESVEVPAWIGCIDTKIDGLIVTGCYDGRIQIMNSNNLKVTNSIAAHDEPIRGLVCWDNKEKESNVFIATASKDQSVKCWSLTNTREKKEKTETTGQELTLAANLVGHVNSLESVDYWNAQQMLLTGDWSGNIFGWGVKGLENDR
jgi:ribosome biogenesis protein YTM1